METMLVPIGRLVFISTPTWNRDNNENDNVLNNFKACEWKE